MLQVVEKQLHLVLSPKKKKKITYCESFEVGIVLCGPQGDSLSHCVEIPHRQLSKAASMLRCTVFLAAENCTSLDI